MIKKICDRCGHEIINPIAKCQNPYLEIKYIIPTGTAPIDLCGPCSEDFEKWLRGKNEQIR
jgi:hypothetical protein